LGSESAEYFEEFLSFQILRTSLSARKKRRKALFERSEFAFLPRACLAGKKDSEACGGGRRPLLFYLKGEIKIY